jgi:hypothetical protein
MRRWVTHEGSSHTHMVYGVPISTDTAAGPNSVSTGGSGTNCSASSPLQLPPAQKPFSEHSPSQHLNSGSPDSELPHGLTT